MKSATTKRFPPKVIIWSTVAICVFESITKGYASVALIFTSFIALPLYVILELKVIKNEHGPYGRPLKVAGLVLTAVTLILYIFTVGFGDAGRIYLFGVYATTDTTGLAEFSLRVSQLAYYLTPTTGLVLIGLLIANNEKHTEDK